MRDFPEIFSVRPKEPQHFLPTKFMAGRGGAWPVAGFQPFKFGVTRWPGKPQTGLLAALEVV